MLHEWFAWEQEQFRNKKKSERAFGNFVKIIERTPEDRLPQIVYPYIEAEVTEQLPSLIPWNEEDIITRVKKLGRRL